MVENIYASSVAKTVFVWICIIALFIAWYFSITGAKLIGNEEAIQKLPLVGKYVHQYGIAAIKSIKPYGTLIYLAIKLAEYGGMIAFVIAISFMVLYESTWRPYKWLEHVNNDQLVELIETTELTRLKKKYNK
jgi:hypothetical protein